MRIQIIFWFVFIVLTFGVFTANIVKGKFQLWPWVNTFVWKENRLFWFHRISGLIYYHSLPPVKWAFQLNITFSLDWYDFPYCHWRSFALGVSFFSILFCFSFFHPFISMAVTSFFAFWYTKTQHSKNWTFRTCANLTSISIFMYNFSVENL